MECESCGMSMYNAVDFGGGQTTSKYCRYCAPDGVLRSREEIRESWISAVMRMEGIDRAKAENKVDKKMCDMPAWKN